MKSRKYKNFDEALYKLGREILLKPNEMIDYTISNTAYIEDIVLTMQSFDCSLDISHFGCRKNKWTKTVNTCINKKGLKTFYKLLETNGEAIGYTFDGDSPLLSVLLTRHDNRQKWRKCVVYMKSVELQRSLAVYLVFISVFLRQLPKCCNIKEVTFHIGLGYVNSTYVNGLIDYYDLGVEEMNSEHPFVKSVITTNRKFFRKGCKLSNYQIVKNMQQLYFGMLKETEIRVVDLELGV